MNTDSQDIEPIVEDFLYQAYAKKLLSRPWYVVWKNWLIGGVLVLLALAAIILWQLRSTEEALDYASFYEFPTITKPRSADISTIYLLKDLVDEGDYRAAMAELSRDLQTETDYYYLVHLSYVTEMDGLGLATIENQKWKTHQEEMNWMKYLFTARKPNSTSALESQLPNLPFRYQKDAQLILEDYKDKSSIK